MEPFKELDLGICCKWIGQNFYFIGLFGKNFRGWKEKLLSQAGREVLIKAIIQAISTYTMSCFSLPRTP